MFDLNRNTHFRISSSNNNGTYVGPTIFSEPHDTFLSRRVTRIILALIFLSIPGMLIFAQSQSSQDQQTHAKTQVESPIEVNVPTTLAILK